MMGNLVYGLMVLEYRLKALFSPPAGVLAEVPLRQGMSLLDFGCGPGRYTAPAARMVGESGQVYALDEHPLALRIVQRMARKAGLSNIRVLGPGTPGSEGTRQMSDGSVDVVLLYDVLHEVAEKPALLRELHRLLRPEGVLSFRDHHLEQEEALALVTEGSLFQLARRGKATLTFARR
jgi:ubiquinone/menaquinone biosynthesis C-methylase UbiE